MLFYYLSFCFSICPIQRLNSSDTLICNIYECVFDSFYSSLPGSVTYISNSSLQVSIKQCLFMSCVSEGRGGAIYIVSSNSFLVDKTCAYSCYSMGNFFGQFAYIMLKSGVDHCFSFISLIKCAPNRNNCNASIHMYDGSQRFLNNNITNNHGYQSSGGYFCYSNGLDCRFCTFSGNTVQNGIIFELIGGINSRVFSMCNIVNNISPSKGIISTRTDTVSNIFSECIFYNNTNILAYSLEGSVTLNMCLIDHPAGSLSTGSVQINSMIPASSKSYSLSFFSTALCFTEFKMTLVRPKTKNVLRVVLLSMLEFC